MHYLNNKQFALKLIIIFIFTSILHIIVLIFCFQTFCFYCFYQYYTLFQIQNNKQTLILKTIVIGTCAAGKTSCIRKLVYNTFDLTYKTTIGVDFSSYSTQVKQQGTNEETNVLLQVWDVAGQDRCSTISRTLRKGAFGIVMVADLSSDSILEDIQLWLDACKDLTFPNTDDVPVPKILWCNKIDLPKSKEFWDNPENQEKLKQFQFDEIYATSAITGENLKQSIQKLAEKMVEMTQKYSKREEDILDILAFDETSVSTNKQGKNNGNNCC